MLKGRGVHLAAKPSPSICFEHCWLTPTQWTFRNVLLCHTAAHSQAWVQAASLTLPHPGTDAILVYGVEHLTDEADAAEAIWQRRPSAVVVETAVCPEHGAATGNIVAMHTPPSNFFVGMFQGIGRQLSQEPDLTSSHLWQRLKLSWNGEQLAYIAALSVSADIVFGDRPKHGTFRRLAAMTSLADLDQAFGKQIWLNYLELLEGQGTAQAKPDSMGLVDRIMLLEREAVLCQSLSQAACRGGRSVVGVVGASHLPGIQRLWQSGEWQAVCAELGDGSDRGSSPGSMSPCQSANEEYWGAPFQASEDEETASEGRGSMRSGCDAPGLSPDEECGVRRALLESVVRSRCVPSVVEELKRARGDLPHQSWEAYCWAHELYASPRMLLACLTREQLERVCCSWQCDMWDVLAPLRAARPINGGSALDIELTADLRSLNIDFT